MFHFRGGQPARDWPDSVARLPAHYSVKAVDNVQQLAEAKAVNPGIVRILRHFTGSQVPGNTYEESRHIASNWLPTFVDGTFLSGSTAGVLHATTEYVEDWNEYGWTPSQSQFEKDRWTNWAIALMDVWYEDYWPELGTNLIVGNIPIGNDCDIRVAERVAYWTDVKSGKIPRIGYHCYWPVRNNVIFHPENNWRYYSGRWTHMDAEFRRAGLTVHWALTEAGSLGYHGDPPSLHPNNGWKDPDVHNGNIHEYLKAIGWFMQKWHSWNVENGWRCLSPNLFDTRPYESGAWKTFQIYQPNLNDIADYVANRWNAELPTGNGSPPPPVEPRRAKLTTATNIRLSPYYSRGDWNKIFTLPSGSEFEYLGKATGEAFRGSTIWYAVKLNVEYESGNQDIVAYLHSELADLV